MKKIILFLFSITICLLLSPRILVQAFEKDNVRYEINADGQTVTFEGLTERIETETYCIPEKVEVGRKSYTVTTIGDSNPLYNLSAKKIVFPATLCSMQLSSINLSTYDLTVAPGNSTYQVKNNILYTSDGKTALRSGRQQGRVKIPEGTEKIVKGAFYSSELQTLELPDSVTALEKESFEECKNLTTVSLGKRFRKIGQWAFYGCDKLSKFIVDEENPYMVEKKGALYTKNMKKLLYVGAAKGTLKVPKKTMQIAQKAFYGNKAVEKVIIQGKMKKLSKRSLAFSRIKNVVLPDSLREIDEEAFMACTELQKVKVPDNVSKINARVFEGCWELKEVTLPQKLKIIEKEVFKSCYALRQIKLPKVLCHIKQGAFEYCGFSKLVIPKSVKRIDKNALKTTIGTLIFKSKKVPKIAKQETCEMGRHKELVDVDGMSDSDIGLAPDASDATYSMEHGISKIRVPAEGLEKYMKVLKVKMSVDFSCIEY